jgi:DeoR/GlpR family transcriptional regulator of sugar metabolism
MKRGLNEVEVMRLRDLREKGVLEVRREARALGVSVETIRRAVRGDTYAHLADKVRATAELAAEAQASAERFAQLVLEERERMERGDKLVEELATSPRAAGYLEE